ncbi:MAG: TRAP transporter small permease subunit [Methylobacteriaceae bacterium]|nr:TRAP transporter small permease subunit [Methylobacteriaceae bacterium]
MPALLRLLERASMAVAILCVALIMTIISADAISRYAFRAPIPWAFELLTYYLMVAGIYFAVAPTFTHGDHIGIDLFSPKMSPAAKARWGTVSSVLAGVVFALIAFASGEATYEAWSNREFLPGYIVWPAWLSHAPVVFGSALIAARLFLHAFTLLTKGHDPDVAAGSTDSEAIE